MTTAITKRPIVIYLALTFAITASMSAMAYEPAGTPADWGPPIKRLYFGQLLIDRFESQWGNNEDSYVWDATGWYGGDVNRVWMKTEGEGAQGEAPSGSTLQFLYGRLIAPFWDLQLGLRQDFRPRPQKTQAVIGIQGLAPYKFEVDAALFVSEDGNTTFQLEAEYEILFTQKLILQPRFELIASFSESEAADLQRGINSTDIGLRLRYEFVREFGVYTGVTWLQKYAAAADAARRAGEPTNNTALVVGIRAWF